MDLQERRWNSFHLFIGLLWLQYRVRCFTTIYGTLRELNVLKLSYKTFFKGLLYLCLKIYLLCIIIRVLVKLFIYYYLIVHIIIYVQHAASLVSCQLWSLPIYYFIIYNIYNVFLYRNTHYITHNYWLFLFSILLL